MLDATKYFKIFMFLLLSLDKYISSAFTHPCVLMHTDMHNLSEWQSAVICYTSIERKKRPSLEALPDPPSVGPCKDREHEQMNNNEMKGFKRQIWSFNSVHFVNLVQYPDNSGKWMCTVPPPHAVHHHAIGTLGLSKSAFQSTHLHLKPHLNLDLELTLTLSKIFSATYSSFFSCDSW